MYVTDSIGIYAITENRRQLESCARNNIVKDSLITAQEELIIVKEKKFEYLSVEYDALNENYGKVKTWSKVKNWLIPASGVVGFILGVRL